MKTLSQIISEGLGLGDKPDYVSVKAMTTVIKKDTAVYMVSETCKRRFRKDFVFRVLDVSRRTLWKKSR